MSPTWTFSHDYLESEYAVNFPFVKLSDYANFQNFETENSAN